ncbi:hypothetical protein FACHB389_32065 [Nostoc calcicola FACHB-389]|nr:hypothetical protein [Nostoc calcicola FACHB-3891]MDZ8057787.1 hypothetical protein [Nostoc sp. EkiNYC01]OKH21050.1 hypothetical protein FACHB389_32065 [Nostoc calcicola FACHB-389]
MEFSRSQKKLIACFFVRVASRREGVQVGEPGRQSLMGETRKTTLAPQRTGFSAPLWFVKKTYFDKEF